MKIRVLVILLAAVAVLVPAVAFEFPAADARGRGDITLKMYVVKASRGGTGRIPAGADAIAEDLKSSGYDKFELVKSTIFSLPSGATDTFGLARGYSVEVTPKGSSRRASVNATFFKGTKKIASTSNTATKRTNAMFVLGRVYGRGTALIVVFELR